MDMLEIWDNLVLLSGGNLIYSGSIKQLDNYLNTHGYQIYDKNGNLKVNPVEYTLELLANPIQAQLFIERWTNQNIIVNNNKNNNNNTNNNLLTANNQVDHIISDITNNTTSKKFTYTSMLTISWNHFKTLSLRQSLYLWRSIHGATVMLIRNLLGGALFGILYFRNGHYLENEKNIVDFQAGFFTPYCSNMQSLQFTTIIFLIAINAIAVPAMSLASLLYQREQVSFIYSRMIMHVIIVFPYYYHSTFITI